MTRKHKIIIAVVLLLLPAVLMSAAVLLLPRLLDPEAQRVRIIEGVKAALNRDFQFSAGKFSIWPFPAFSFYGIVIKEKDAQADFITAERLYFKLSLLPLLQKEIVLREAVLENPRIILTRKADGSFNIGDLLAGAAQETSLGVERLSIQNGFLQFTDHLISPQPPTFSLERVNLRLGHIERGRNVDIFLAAAVGEGANASVALNGTLEIAAAQESVFNSRLDAAVKINGFELGLLWPYVGGYVPFNQVKGRLDVATRFTGTSKQFESAGSLTLHELHFDYPAVFRAVLGPGRVRVAYGLKRDAHRIDVTRFDADIDGASVKGSCLIADIHTDDILIDARAATSEISWDKYRHYIPYGIIPANVSAFISQKIKAGVFHLEEGRLHGRVSRIASMDKDDNADVLQLRGGARMGVLQYAPDVPAFTNISGILEIKGKDFILREMRGKFGEAPFSLEGRLTGYCLDTPTRYPFAMNISPTTKEIVWLMGDKAAQKWRYAGKSALALSGDGTTANYLLKAAWDLSAAAYSYDDLVKKPAGKANNLSFEVTLTDKQADFSSIRFKMPPLVLDASARFGFTAKNRGLSFDVEMQAVELGKLAPFMPRIQKIAPKGQIRASVKAQSRPQDTADMLWRGEVALGNVSLQPGMAIAPVSGITGKIFLSGDALETSQMNMRIGGTTVSVRGAVRNFRDPAFEAGFAAERLDTADFGFRHPEQTVLLEKVEGLVALQNRDLRIDALTFKLNDSVLNIGGLLRGVTTDTLLADIKASAPFLDWQDIVILSRLKRTAKVAQSKAQGAVIALKADIQAEAGRIKRLAFRELKTNLSLDHSILYVHALTAGALDGELSLSGRIDLTDAAPRYHFNFDMARLSAAQCIDLFEIKERFVTGTLSAKGNLTAKGENITELKKTALGHVGMRMEEGMLTRFAVLSKIFSILNISQLFKFQLPDMVRGGMPYESVSATLSFANGNVSTKDFFIHSNAMNISAVGAIDMPRGEFVDMIVGVQPLQTVDKIVGRIPVIGWILTDDKGNLMSVYFEVKGALDNPSVTAIPVKAIARGVFDIFRNIFQLPVKLFTDTGEVIFGR